MDTARQSVRERYLLTMLWAVHIADGVLDWPWLFVGFIVAVILIAISSWKVSDSEIPKIGMIAAAMFVASQIHVPLGVSSVHLLLNGIAGSVIGRRAPLAIAVGLFLQSILFGHGGKLAWGVNVCILTIPALIIVAWEYARPLRNRSLPIGFQRFMITMAAGLWLALAITTVQVSGFLNRWRCGC
jgi:ABC-type Co2+ transport system permease subunit